MNASPKESDPVDAEPVTPAVGADRVTSPDVLGKVLKEVTDSIDTLSRVAIRSTFAFLLAVATALAVVALLLKAIPGFQLGSAEVVAACVLSVGLVAFAGLLKYLEFRSALEVLRHQIWQEQRYTDAELRAYQDSKNKKLDPWKTDNAAAQQQAETDDLTRRLIAQLQAGGKTS